MHVNASMWMLPEVKLSYEARKASLEKNQGFWWISFMQIPYNIEFWNMQTTKNHAFFTHPNFSERTNRRWPKKHQGLEDRRRDKASQPRRLMHFIMQVPLREWNLEMKSIHRWVPVWLLKTIKFSAKKRHHVHVGCVFISMYIYTCIQIICTEILFCLNTEHLRVYKDSSTISDVLLPDLGNYDHGTAATTWPEPRSCVSHNMFKEVRFCMKLAS